MHVTNPRKHLLLILLLSALFSALTPDPVRAQPLEARGPITIFNDNGFTPPNGVRSGTGTSPDPYIISDWDINGTTGRDQGSIHIRGTTRHFVIRNVYVHPTTLLSEAAGILFQNVQNGVIENVRITNTTYGVWIANSSQDTLKNSTIWANTNGIYVTSALNVEVSDNDVSNSTRYGVWVASTTSSLFARNTSHNNTDAGFIVSASQNNLFDGNIGHNNSDWESNPRGYGFRILSSTNNTFANNVVFNNPFGMVFESSHGNLATGNRARFNLYGMGLECAVGCSRQTTNTFRSNNVTDNNFGIYIYNSTQNTVYDNYLRNPGNAYDNTNLNSWNITRTVGTNIFGGPLLGGNYYSNYAGTDQDGDGFGDTPYSILGGVNTDKLPLMLQQPISVRDLAATSVTVQPSSGKVGTTFTINITVANLGTTTESSNVTALYNQTPIGTQPVTNLAQGASATYSFTWTTAGLAVGNYSITGRLASFPGETNTGNNNSPPATASLLPNLLPIASFTATPSTPMSGQAVLFDASESNDPDGTVQSYLWNFGDGQSATGLTMTHSFSNAQNYVVTLTVTDDNGATGASQQTITVSAVAPTEPLGLEASFSNGRVLLVWSAPGSNGGSPIIGYNIYRGVNPTAFQKIQEVGNVLTYEDTLVSNGQVYYYRVTAVNSALLEGTNSEQKNVTVPLPDGPGTAPDPDKTLLYVALGVLLAILAAAVVLVLRRRSRQ